MKHDQMKMTGWLVLFFPLLVLAGFWGKAAMNRDHGGEIWQIRMTGYDPRDLFYGHYLRYRYDWNLENGGESSYTRSAGCLCLNESDTGHKNPQVRPLRCGDKKPGQCAALLNVRPYGGSWLLNKSESFEKYFIPEEKADQIDSLFRKREVPFYIELTIHKDGAAAVRGLLVGDTPLEDYLRSLPPEERK